MTTAAGLSTPTRGPRADKSPARIAIEDTLKAADAPLTKLQLVTRCNLPLRRVQLVLGTLCQLRMAHRVPASAECSESRFAWGGRPAALAAATATAAAPVAPSTARVHAGNYQGKELHAFAGRPGAMDAFKLPSVQNGERVARKAPVIMGCTPAARKTP